MITSRMKNYDFYLVEGQDEYNQDLVSSSSIGKIKMDINILNQSETDSILYSGATLLGLTKEPVDETYLIEFNGDLYKVKYVNPMGRYNQVFMGFYGN